MFRTAFFVCSANLNNQTEILTEGIFFIVFHFVFRALWSQSRSAFLWWNPSVSGGKAHSSQRKNSGNPFFICVRKSWYLYAQKQLANDIQNVACLIPNLLFFKETLKILFFLCQITRCDPCPWPGHTKQHPICQTISRILDAEVFSLGKLQKMFSSCFLT